jgi:CheY-like chemotaxis protein
VSLQGPIIFVDDNRHEHTLIRTVFRELSVRNDLLCFSLAAKALEHLTTSMRDPFIIISDLRMPEMDGLEFRQRIWENHALRKKSIPFIFRTGSATIEDVNKAYEMTVQGFFRKNTDYLETSAQFRRILDYWSDSLAPSDQL